MAIVRPFRGLRPTPDRAAKVACPPYDVLSSEEARAMAEGNPITFLRVDKAELEFPPDFDPYSRDVYKRGRDNLFKLFREGVLIQDPTPCFYIYRLSWQGRSQTGLAALSSVDEYDRGLIRKHEHIRPEKMVDRANHIMTLEAQVGLVFSTYKASAATSAAIKKVTSTPPVVDFETPGSVRQELWVVSREDDITMLVDAFAKLPVLYIADGHHRSAAASEVCRRMREKTPGYTGNEPFNFFLNVLFPAEELRILPYNRVVKDLNGHTLETLLEQASAKFEVSRHGGEIAPQRAHEFGLYSGGSWYLLRARNGSFDAASPTKSIDASVLADNFLAPLLGITDPKTDKRIDFVGGIRGTGELVRLVDSGKYKAAFSLYPTSVQQLLAVADAGEVMPPKSTWFEPKLFSGLVVSLLTD
ncbi:MAG: DUF1015 family protein [candidate division Zixibacteria bacterium]|nr:DUF1015 family protein [candidate division Zixibacteria bacterium]